MIKDIPVLAITPGEPAGIGPECTIRLVQEHPELRLLAIADPQLLSSTADALGFDIKINQWQPGGHVSAGELSCFPQPLQRPATAGQLDSENAAYVVDSIKTAVKLVLAGHAAALVTGPVHKAVINDGGIPFSGHTELLAELAGLDKVVMMLAAGDLRVALVTTHLPLREVADAITFENVLASIQITHQELRSRFGITEPVIQVLGLNPHAGEGGHLGFEDADIIQKAIDHSNTAGINAIGPVPADSAFTPTRLAACDAVVAMYHDQGLPVLKHAGFGKAVNITLGLPFIRTSVDHGTALDIAGKNRASASSMYIAAKTAQGMCQP
ncbi:MAG: 4-hydroxythreonine-4-phosphate dehydrogenase PdxA [Xanthomonadales bacterium]|nr:4-hydroxythreonine-4-phosphate dehydrogenase PdxA [Xanthomonadales bacterium]